MARVDLFRQRAYGLLHRLPLGITEHDAGDGGEIGAPERDLIQADQTISEHPQHHQKVNGQLEKENKGNELEEYLPRLHRKRISEKEVEYFKDPGRQVGHQVSRSSER